MSIYCQTGRLYRTHGTHRSGKYPLHTQNALSRRDNTHRSGTTRLYGQVSCPGTLYALGCKPRVNLTRFHGVFVPNSRLRKQITLKARRRGSSINDAVKSPVQRQTAMSWVQRLKRVFNIEIETCSQYGSTVKIIACIEDPTVIKQILDHLSSKSIKPNPHPVRAHPKVTQPVLS